MDYSVFFFSVGSVYEFETMIIIFPEKLISPLKFRNYKDMSKWSSDLNSKNAPNTQKGK